MPFAEIERSLIKERQREGIELAKAKTGKERVYLEWRDSLTTERAADLRKRAAAGEAKAGLAREFGVSRAELYVYVKAD